jgi:DNA-binding NarL/FixJ family response regulator
MAPEIAKKLGISSRTVETFKEDILRKMRVRNVAGIVLYAIKNGLVQI